MLLLQILPPPPVDTLHADAREARLLVAERLTCTIPLIDIGAAAATQARGEGAGHGFLVVVAIGGHEKRVIKQLQCKVGLRRVDGLDAVEAMELADLSPVEEEFGGHWFADEPDAVNDVVALGDFDDVAFGECLLYGAVEVLLVEVRMSIVPAPHHGLVKNAEGG